MHEGGERRTDTQFVSGTGAADWCRTATAAASACVTQQLQRQQHTLSAATHVSSPPAGATLLQACWQTLAGAGCIW